MLENLGTYDTIKSIVGELESLNVSGNCADAGYFESRSRQIEGCNARIELGQLFGDDPVPGANFEHRNSVLRKHREEPVQALLFER